MKNIELHLVSDSTGETVSSIARSVIALFEGVEPNEHIWSLVRTKGQLEKVIQGIRENPGIVLYTIIDPAMQDLIRAACRELNVPCIDPLSRVISDVAAHLGMKMSAKAGGQHELDEDYFKRVEAINFSISHDDGQATWDLDNADIVLVGVSRTSKSPTCVYLSYRGYRTANVPLVKDCPLPENLLTATHPLIVGLVIAPERLAQIRRSRLLSLNEQRDTNYVDIEYIKEEVAEARKLFQRHKWPVIDVTRKSVEETSATIIQYYQAREKGDRVTADE